MTQIAAPAATFAVIESRKGVHVGTVPGFVSLRSAELRARKDIRLGYCDSAAVWTATEAVAFFGTGR